MTYSLTAADVRISSSGGQTTRSGYVIQDVNGRTSITCLRCGFTSHNANDVREKYCGHCHVFHEDVR